MLGICPRFSKEILFQCPSRSKDGFSHLAVKPRQSPASWVQEDGVSNPASYVSFLGSGEMIICGKFRAVPVSQAL
jgi:hypothetical protein